ncbi:MAG: 3-methyl-2-oxobutanoate hydroxymethyltransferase [Firmicutes bacterium]|nr:3-methyl-2-oxobutanoate hydroxymethyltransferase [Bacillota bacterium]
MSGKTVHDLQEMKARGERIVMVTAYDYPSARCAQEAGVDVILVGDSLGNVVLGYETTIPVRLEDMLRHVSAVTRAEGPAHVVCDMPFMTYQVSAEEALRNAARLVQEGGAQSVKLEGGEAFAPTVRRIVEAGIPVMAHIGLTPQSVHRLGGYRVQGRSAEAARRLLEDALALQDAGAYSLVLEAVPWQLAAEITRRLRIPTIGIGAGAGCDGQVLVFHDLVGYSFGTPAKFVRRYADVRQVVTEALRRFGEDVRRGAYPGDAERYSMKDEEWRRLQAEIGGEGDGA